MGGGRPPPAGPPPTPGNDPLDCFSAPRGADEASASSSSVGPIRTPRQSPSPSPYGVGGDTPRPPRVSSASQAAARAGTASFRSASPPVTLGSPAGSTQGEDPFAIIPDNPQTSGVGWTISEFTDGLVDTASWLDRAVSPLSSVSLSAADKVLIHVRVAALLQAVDAAGVGEWGSLDVGPRSAGFSRFSPPPFRGGGGALCWPGIGMILWWGPRPLLPDLTASPRPQGV